MIKPQTLDRLSPGMPLLVGGDRMVPVSEELAASFRPGDALSVVAATGEVLHLPAKERAVATDAVSRGLEAFRAMGSVSDAAISRFFESFAARLADDGAWSRVAEANRADVAAAEARGRSTTRLVASEKMRSGMIDGLLGWAKAESVRGRVLERVEHGSWSAELVGAELGVVAFVFEGRPNVVADATGVLRGGNTVVFRIGRDALGTAKALVEGCAAPALREAGLPEGAVTVLDSASHASGWALFGDGRLALAVARGSGQAVATLGSLARAAGVPVSLHGTGGAWLALGASAAPEDITACVADSLDRKVCNTLNTCCVLRSEAARQLPHVFAGLERAAERRRTAFKLHVEEGSEAQVPAELFTREVTLGRAEGPVREPQAELLQKGQLGREWEWEDSPEVTLVVVESLEEAAQLFNEQSPQFVVSLLSDDQSEQAWFYERVNAPFVGDGFTRWVDGQYALGRPELGLSNWESGRLFGRGGILTGDGAFTLRTRVRGTSSGRPR
jgi:glutamate-5-semialdehyde dehydrogenase